MIKLDFRSDNHVDKMFETNVRKSDSLKISRNSTNKTDASFTLKGKAVAEKIKHVYQRSIYHRFHLRKRRTLHNAVKRMKNYKRKANFQ